MELQERQSRRSVLRRAIVLFLPLFVGVALLTFGVISILSYYGQPAPATIGGTEVMEAAQCSGGYATGSCPVLAVDWTGTLVDPSPLQAGGIVSIWGLHAGDVPVDTCELPATYLVDLPTTAGNSTQETANSTEPAYLPLSTSIRGVITYGSLLYVYTPATYNVADHCTGAYLATTSTSILQGSITYSSNGTPQTLVLGNNFGYRFEPANFYFATAVAGAVVTIFGFLWAFGDFIWLNDDSPGR